MGFTKEELAEMARADAEIEASFRLTPEDLKLQKEMDRFASFDRLDNRRKKVAAWQKAYREANREKVAAWQKAYREANREKVAAQKKAYYEANREKVAAQKKAYYEANREKVAAQQKAYYEANREKVAAPGEGCCPAEGLLRSQPGEGCCLAEKSSIYQKKKWIIPEIPCETVWSFTIDCFALGKWEAPCLPTRSASCLS